MIIAQVVIGIASAINPLIVLELILEYMGPGFLRIKVAVAI